MIENCCIFIYSRIGREISDKISGRMKDVATGLRGLKSAVESDQLSSAVVPQDCCKDGVYTENVRFRANVTSYLFP